MATNSDASVSDASVSDTRPPDVTVCDIPGDGQRHANEIVAFAVALNRTASQAAEALKTSFRIVVSKVHEHDPQP